MFASVRRRLSRKILLALAGSVIPFTAMIIFIVNAHQARDMTREMHIYGEHMEHVVYAGIKYPMTIGDKEQVQRELHEISAATEGLEVYICDTRQNIVFASRQEAVRSGIARYVTNRRFLKALKEQIRTGNDPERVYEDTVDNRRYLVTTYPLFNKTECHQCHGSSQKVLGSMVVKKNAEASYTSIRHLRIFNIAVGTTGIVALILLMKIILDRIVKRPLAEITANLETFAAGVPHGDYSARIAIRRSDEIGSVIDSFDRLAEKLEQTHRELAEANSDLRRAQQDLVQMNDQLEQRVEEKTRELQESERQVRAFARRLTETEVHERKRLSQELHDEIGQSLSLLGIHLNRVRSHGSRSLPDSILAGLDDSVLLAEQVTDRVRSVMSDLRPPVLDDYGLAAALKWYAWKFTERTGIPADVEAENLSVRLSSALETALFRIAQELLTNVAKHAGATRVSVTVLCDGACLRMEVADNGRGFDPDVPRPKGHWGLINVTERAQSIGGLLRIDAGVGQGTRVGIEVAV